MAQQGKNKSVYFSTDTLERTEKYLSKHTKMSFSALVSESIEFYIKKEHPIERKETAKKILKLVKELV